MISMLWQNEKAMVLGASIGMVHGLYSSYQLSQADKNIGAFVTGVFSTLLSVYGMWIAIGVGVVSFGIGYLQQSEMAIDIGKFFIAYAISKWTSIRAGGMVFTLSSPGAASTKLPSPPTPPPPP